MLDLSLFTTLCLYCVSSFRDDLSIKTYKLKILYFVLLTMSSYLTFMKFDYRPNEKYILNPNQESNIVFKIQLLYFTFNLIMMHREELDLKIHHIFTFIMLFFFSYLSEYYHIGSVVLALHASADIFLHFGKLMAISNCYPLLLQKLNYVLLLIFWAYDRLIRFPLVIYCAWCHYTNTYIGACAVSCAYLLYMLHWFWFIKILNLGYKKFIKDSDVDNNQIHVKSH